MSAKRCAGKTKAGKPCRAYAISDSRYCVTHDPGQAAARQAWRKAGGHATKTPEGEPIRVRTVEQVLEQAWANLGATWEQANTDARTRGINSTLGVILKAFEIGDLAERVEALEELFAELQQERERRALERGAG